MYVNAFVTDKRCLLQNLKNAQHERSKMPALLIYTVLISAQAANMHIPFPCSLYLI